MGTLAKNGLISFEKPSFAISKYSGISIKRTHYKVDTSIRRTVCRGTDCCAQRSNY